MQAPGQACLKEFTRRGIHAVSCAEQGYLFLFSQCNDVCVRPFIQDEYNGFNAGNFRCPDYMGLGEAGYEQRIRGVIIKDGAHHIGAAGALYVYVRAF